MPKNKVQIEIIVHNKTKPKRKRKLTPYNQFTREFMLRTGGDMASAAAAWNQVKKQSKGKNFDVNFS